MTNSYEKLARILNTSSEVLSGLDEKMATLSGKTGGIDAVVKSNDEHVDRMLSELGLSGSASAEDVYGALTDKLIQVDQRLFELLGKPNLSKLSNDPGMLRDTALKVFTPPKGFFIKKEKVVELLEKQSPQSLLEHFGYSSITELIQKEGFAPVVSALRFTQSTEWMHKFFEAAYKDLTPGDFEDREVEIIILSTKWLEIAQKFMGKKFHNVSHLKEFGVIFISPDPIDMPGETLRMFVLLLHYLHEVPFYSGLFRRFVNDGDFIAKLQSLLRGDVLEIEEAKRAAAQSGNWLVIQRYLAKDDTNDLRLSLPHVDPEAEHWYLVSQNFQKLGELVGNDDKFNISRWANLDYVGDFFKSADGSDKLVSFGVVDLVMSVVKRGEVKYLYHQQEALWNRIFVEYFGREKMNRLIEENIIKGYIEL